MERKKKLVKEKNNYELLIQFMSERGLDKKNASRSLYTTNIIEELYEGHGVKKLNKEKAIKDVLSGLFISLGLENETSIKQNVDSLFKNNFSGLCKKQKDKEIEASTLGYNCLFKPHAQNLVSQHELVDFANDIFVFSSNYVYNLGYDSEKAHKETCKEILSREGSLNSEGRFVKDMSEEAQAKWYSADYESCKRK